MTLVPSLLVTCLLLMGPDCKSKHKTSDLVTLQKSFLEIGSEGSQPWMLPHVQDEPTETSEIPEYESTACKCRPGNRKCWTTCARIYQKRRDEISQSEQTLPDILKESAEIDDILYGDLVDTSERNSAESPVLEELLDRLPFPWRRNIYRLIQEAEMAELEKYL